MPEASASVEGCFDPTNIGQGRHAHENSERQGGYHATSVLKPDRVFALKTPASSPDVFRDERLPNAKYHEFDKVHCDGHLLLLHREHELFDVHIGGGAGHS